MSNSNLPCQDGSSNNPFNPSIEPDTPGAPPTGDECEQTQCSHNYEGVCNYKE